MTPRQLARLSWFRQTRQDGEIELGVRGPNRLDYPSNLGMPGRFSEPVRGRQGRADQ